MFLLQALRLHNVNAYSNKNMRYEYIPLHGKVSDNKFIHAMCFKYFSPGILFHIFKYHTQKISWGSISLLRGRGVRGLAPGPRIKKP